MCGGRRAAAGSGGILELSLLNEVTSMPEGRALCYGVFRLVDIREMASHTCRDGLSPPPHNDHQLPHCSKLLHSPKAGLGIISFLPQKAFVKAFIQCGEY